MLYTFLVTILIIDAIVLIAAILLQSGKGGGLAANFGGASSSPDAFIGVRQAGTILTKASWWCGGIFLALAFILQIMGTSTRAPRSILERSLATPPASAPATTAPATGGTALPLEPATPAPVTPAPTNSAPPPAQPRQ